MNILFICKFNRFRSVLAEAHFNARNKNLDVHAKSAGLIRGSSIDERLREIEQRHWFTVKPEPEGLSTDLLDWQDMIVIVADDVPESVFRDHRVKNQNITTWSIPDKTASAAAIFAHVEQLIESLPTN